MATKNDITGDKIQSKALSVQGAENFDKIFSKEWDCLIFNKQLDKMVSLGSVVASSEIDAKSAAIKKFVILPEEEKTLKVQKK